MFWLSKFKDYGLKIITWDFWTWKTKNLYQDAFLRKKKFPDWLLIANIPYDFVDLHFSSKEDLDKIIEYISLYIEKTNTTDRFKAKDFPLIRIIIDEAHLYFFSRDFKAMNKTALLILTQCRKRYIQVDFITQELAQLDVFMRRLMPYVMNYERRLFGFQRATMYYFKVAEVSDIGDEMQVEEIESEYIRPDFVQKRFNKGLEDYFSQRYLTYYVIWKNRVLADYTFEDFYALIEKHRNMFLFYTSKNYGMVADNEKLSNSEELQENIQSPWIVANPWFRSHKIGANFTQYIWMKLFGEKYRNNPNVSDLYPRLDTVQDIFHEKTFDN